jgi:hypothetical protein
MGLLSSIGFYDGKSRDGKETRMLEPVLEKGVFFFPFLDEYWTHPGRVFIEANKVKETRMMTFKLQLADCLREAVRRDELYKLVDPSKRPDLRHWLSLGGVV